MDAAKPGARPIAQCKCLRSKEMYYQPHGQEDDPCAGGIFWCTKTMEGYGPDGGVAGREECAAGRSCFLS